MKEKIIEIKSCKKCLIQFEITDKDLNFYDKLSPIFNGVKYNIPTPTLCPDCRQQRRLAFRNERKLYHRKCDLTGNQIISMYSPDKPYKVYEISKYKEDDYNPFIYGREFDFTRSFFDQLKELYDLTPKQSIFSSRSNDNSVYTNYCSGMKNSYLVNDSMDTKDSLYGLKVSFCNSCIDCDYVIHSEYCYGCTDCMNCYNVTYSHSCKDCKNSLYLYDCINCSDCFMCKGLYNKSHYIQNQPYTKEEYEKKKIDLLRSNSENLEKLFNEFCLTIPSRNVLINNSEGSSGSNLNNCKSSEFCFDSFETIDCKYCYRIHTSQDCYDYESWGQKSSLMYEVIGAGASSYRTIFGVCNMSTNVNVIYSLFSSGCKDCFGCASIKDAQYCILNKQYTKDEYEVMVSKIIEHMIKTGEWGEFFPFSMASFGYNETVANDYFPLEREEALRQGFIWSDYEKQNGYNGEYYEPLEIKEYQEEIVGKEKTQENTENLIKGILKCEVTGKPYRIIKQELEFYKKHNIQIPKRHPDQRYLDRLAKRNPRKLYDRKCDKCGIEIKTTYSPERLEIVYCESCYNKEIYG